MQVNSSYITRIRKNVIFIFYVFGVSLAIRGKPAELQCRAPGPEAAKQLINDAWLYKVGVWGLGFRV